MSGQNSSSSKENRDHSKHGAQKPVASSGDASTPAESCNNDGLSSSESPLDRLDAIRQNIQQLQESHQLDSQESQDATSALREWEDTLDLREEGLHQRESGLRSQRSSIEESREELNTLRETLDKASVEIDARISELRQRNAESKEKAVELQEALDNTLASNEQLKSSHASLQEERNSLETQLRESQNAKEQLDALQLEYKTITQDREALRRVVADAKSQAQSLTSEIASLKQSNKKNRDAASQLKELQEKLDEANAQQKTLTKENLSFESDRKSMREALGKLEASLEDAQKSQERLPALEQELQDAKQDKDSLEELLASMESDLQSAAQGTQEANALRDKLAQEASQREALASQIESLKKKSASLQSALQESESNSTPREEVDAEIAQRDLVINKLSAKIEEGEIRFASLKEKAVKTHSANSTQQQKLRTRRLRKMKKLLQVEGKKLSTARRGVAQKHLEAERVLQLKGTLVKQESALRERAEKITKLARRNSMARVACMLAIAIGILGFGAWEVAQRIPSRYLVNATIQAKGPLASDPDELAAWREHMTTMLINTRLIDTAAERMKRRGLEEYASAPALSALINNHLEHTFPSPDTMQISLVGVGDLKTERLLETYLAVFISVTNDAAVSYGGSVSASITQTPVAEARPLDEERLLIMAGGIWGSVTILVLGASVWASSAFAKATAKLRTESSDATARAFSYDGISQVSDAA